jgi:hypothetical protein
MPNFFYKNLKIIIVSVLETNCGVDGALQIGRLFGTENILFCMFK